MNTSFSLYVSLFFCITTTLAQHALEGDVNMTPVTVYENPSLIDIHDRVDAIMEEGIIDKAFPGAQFMAVKNGQVVFHKAYGYHSYANRVPVGRNDLYDLASVTKIAAALPAIMKLVDDGKLDLDTPFSTYWPSWKAQPAKKELTLREILAHQAGLHPYIVFVNTLKKKNGEFKRKYIRSSYSDRFPIRITDHIYLSKKFRKEIYKAIDQSEVNAVKQYKYSGLFFLLVPQLVESLTGVSFRTYVRKNIYEPLNAHTLMFNPQGWYPESMIVPTEKDTIFRDMQVKATVHDENAALMGGVSGNAGLFGTAEDVARLMLMYLQEGRFAGKQVISRERIKEFTKVQYPKSGNRRGLGFDKPLLDNASRSLNDAYPAPAVSMNSFGHSGFTGTFVWADPQGDWVFIFLSNRVNPDRSHQQLYTLNIRERLIELFYQYYKE